MEAGSRALTLGAAAHCSGSTAATALHEAVSALVLFNYKAPLAQPEV